MSSPVEILEMVLTPSSCSLPMRLCLVQDAFLSANNDVRNYLE